VGSLENVQLGFKVLCGVLAALVVLEHRSVWATLKRFFLEPALPINLGLLRIVIFGILLVNAIVSPAAWYAGVPESFRDLPPGWGWTSDVLPITPGRLRRAQILLIVSSALAVVGLFTRPASIVAAVLAVYVFGVPNFYFKIGHGMHVPVLSALVLAASPAGAGASLDAWIRRRRGAPAENPSVAYTVPVRFCWLLVGTMYLFPGLWKLWTSGDQWISGKKLRVELFNKWAQLPDYVPSVRVDEMPAMLVVLGVMTLVIELSYLPALFHRTSRVLVGIAAAGFHVGVGLTMDIWFNPLHPLIVLIDFPAVFQLRGLAPIRVLAMRVWRRRSEARGDAEPTPTEPSSPPPSVPPNRLAWGPSLPTWVLGSAALFGMIYTGAAPIDTWPVAIYPRFHHRVKEPPRDSTALRLVVRSKDGSERVLPPTSHPIEDTAAVFRIARATQRLKNQNMGRRFKEHVALLAYYAREAHGPFEPTDRLLIYTLRFKVDPAERGEPELSLIAETDL